MLKNLLIFKNRQEKNSCSKVTHTLLFKEKFNSLKTVFYTRFTQEILLIVLLFIGSFVLVYFIIETCAALNSLEQASMKSYKVLQELTHREAEIRDLQESLANEIKSASDIIDEQNSKIEELSAEKRNREIAILCFGLYVCFKILFNIIH